MIFPREVSRPLLSEWRTRKSEETFFREALAADAGDGRGPGARVSSFSPDADRPSYFSKTPKPSLEQVTRPPPRRRRRLPRPPPRSRRRGTATPTAATTEAPPSRPRALPRWRRPRRRLPLLLPPLLLPLVPGHSARAPLSGRPPRGGSGRASSRRRRSRTRIRTRRRRGPGRRSGSSATGEAEPLLLPPLPIPQQLRFRKTPTMPTTAPFQRRWRSPVYPDGK